MLKRNTRERQASAANMGSEEERAAAREHSKRQCSRGDRSEAGDRSQQARAVPAGER